jgi:hypothetical protein
VDRELSCRHDTHAKPTLEESLIRTFFWILMKTCSPIGGVADFRLIRFLTSVWNVARYMVTYSSPIS